MALKPTNAELKILQALWKRGPSAVRQVQEELGDETGYTTALKLLQIMFEKGLVKRSIDGRTHIYEPAVAESATKKTLVRDFLDKAFAGSARDLVVQALSAKKPSAKELAEIRKLIEEMERK